MDKPKILIIENSKVVTGALKAIITSSSCLLDSFQFQFIVPRGLTTPTINKAGFSDVRQWNMIEISKRFWPLLFYVPALLINAWRLKRHVKQHNIDLVHINDLYNLIPAVAAFFGCRTPYVCHVRFMPASFPPVLFNTWLRIHFRYAKKIVVVSNALRLALPHHPKIEVVYGGMVFNNSHEHQQTDTRNIFLYLSNIIHGKGQDFALNAFLRVHEQLPEWKLRFVGGDNGIAKNAEFIRSLKEKAKNHSIENKIEWNGFVEDVEQEYRSAAIVLNFSESESFSMSSLEAMSYGRPLIVTDCGGPADLVINQVTGILVPNRDVDAMCDAMLQLANSPTLRNEMGSKAGRHMIENFDAKITTQKLKEVYRNCISGI